MRVIVLLAVVALSAAVNARPLWHELHAGYTFDQYLGDFGKAYSDPEEYAAREAIYTAELAAVMEHNSLGKHTWKKGINHFSDWTDEEFEATMGLKKGANRLVKQDREVFTSTPGFKAPAFIDWRQKGVVGAVKDQGRCGSCWAFASTATLESAWAIATSELPVLSPQQILDSTENPRHCGGTGGCLGGIPEIAYARITELGGLSSEWTYPYISYNGKAGPAFNASRVVPAAKVASYINIAANDPMAHAEALATKGPLAISVWATPWKAYESGVFSCDMTQNVDVNHVVVLVGMGTDPKLGPYWLVKNSWSPTYGEQGYIRLARSSAGTAPVCGTDKTPLDGFGCTGGPSELTVCGTCAVLSDTVFPIVDTTDVQ